MDSTVLNLMRKYLDNIVDSEELQYLFIDDPDTEYYCALYFKFKGFTHLHKCVLLTNKYPILNDYLEEYLKLYDVVTQVNDKKMSALHLAALASRNKSSERTVEILISAGINVNLQDSYGNTALHYAAQYSQTASTEGTVEILINANVDVNLQDNLGRSALCNAASRTKFSSTEHTVEILINAGANINLQDIAGNTPLYYAILYLKTISTRRTIEILIIAGADMNLQNNGNETPFYHLPPELKNYYKEHYINSILSKLKTKEPNNDECIVCFEIKKVYECDYKHGICIDCLIKQSGLVCLFCSHSLKNET